MTLSLWPIGVETSTPANQHKPLLCIRFELHHTPQTNPLLVEVSVCIGLEYDFFGRERDFVGPCFNVLGSSDPSL